MFSAVFFLNTKGNPIIQRLYRSDVSTTISKDFRKLLLSSKAYLPIFFDNNISFVYTIENDVYCVMATRLNAPTMVAFEFLRCIVRIFTAYFGCPFSEEAIRNNFVLVYELLDEMMDNGYPQLTVLDTLRGAISLGKTKINGLIAPSRSLEKITTFITGSVDWREPNKYKYKKNEIFMDVYEAVNVLISSDNTILHADISGKIIMKAFLTGMPECKVSLNEIISIDTTTNNNQSNTKSIVIDDVSFHRCVNLSRFEQDHSISFIPPDGEFTLMKYRINNRVTVPFIVTPSITFAGRHKVEYKITLKRNFSRSFVATNVSVIIPVPPNTASAKCSTTQGRAKLIEGKNVIIWSIPRCTDYGVYLLRSEA